MQENGVGGSEYAPERILIIDGDLSLMYAIRDALQKKNSAAEIKVLTEEEGLELPKDKEYDLIILEDHHDANHISGPTENLINSIRKLYPCAEYVLFSTEQDRNRLADRAVNAAKSGALHYFYKPDTEADLTTRAGEIADRILVAYTAQKLDITEDTDNSVQFEYEATTDNAFSLPEIEDIRRQPPARSSLVTKIEDDLEQRLGDGAKFTPDELKKRIPTLAEPSAKLAANCKLAICLYYNEGKFKPAIEAIEDAMLIAGAANVTIDQSLKTIPLILRGQMYNSFSRTLAEESHQDYHKGISRQSKFTGELIEQVEENVNQFNLKRPIRPTRGNISIVNIGGMECYRRDDPIEQSVRNEAYAYQFYRRIGRIIGAEEELIQVPEVLGVVKNNDKSGWVLYRDHLKGSSLVDEMRKISKAISALENNTDPKAAELLGRKRDLQKNLLMETVSQCAYFLACGPVSLADEITNPLEEYYEPRMNERILDPFDRLFAKAGMKGSTIEERQTMANASQRIHEYLAELPPVFYKDSWFSNTIIRKRGRGFKLSSVDFASMKQLPLVIDLATLLCYGSFVNRSVSKPNELELDLVEKFFTSYSLAVTDFNEFVSSFDMDKKAVLLDEISKDRLNHPTESTENLESLLEFSKPLNFGRLDRTFGKLRKKVKRKQLPVSFDYIRDIERFAYNLKAKEPFAMPMKDTPEYGQMMGELQKQYYAALHHRSLLLASTPCDFIVSKMGAENPLKKYLLLAEVMETLRGSMRGVNMFYTMLPQGMQQSKEQVGLLKIVGGILAKVRSIYKNKKI